MELWIEFLFNLNVCTYESKNVMVAFPNKECCMGNLDYNCTILCIISGHITGKKELKSFIYIYKCILCDKVLLQVPVLLIIQLKIYCKFKFWPTTYMYLYLQHIYWLPVDSNEVQLPMTSVHVPITTKVVSSNSAHGGMYSIQHYTINEF